MRSYPEVDSYLLKTFTIDQEIDEYDEPILRYSQPPSMTLQRYYDDVITRFCKVADVYNEGTLSHVFTKDVKSSIRHSPRNY